MEISKSRWIKIMAAVAIGSFMSALDSSVVNIALPQISTHFNITMSTVEWVVMAYLLVISSLLLTYGRLGDMYGHKKIYLSGFVIFTLGSLICSISPSILVLIIFRGFQAIGAGMLMSMGPAIITDVTPTKDRGKALGINAVSISVALATGPILGGVLTSFFGWQSIFYINIPIGIFGYIMANKFIIKKDVTKKQKFDIPGAVIIFFALITLLLPISYGEEIGWRNPLIGISLFIAFVLFVVFIIVENKTEAPMVDLTMFKNRLFSMSNVSTLINFISQFSVILLMPFYFQQLRGMSASMAGIMMIPMPLTTMLIAPISGILSDKIDSRYLSSLGMFIVALGIFLLSFLNISSSPLQIILFLFIVGFGNGLFQTPNNSAIMGSVSNNRRGIASSMIASMRNIGMVLGVAIAGAVFSSEMSILTISLKEKGVVGTPLQIQTFTGAFHITYVMAACISAVAVVTSMVRGSLKNKLV